MIIDLPELLALQYTYLRAASANPVVGHTSLPIELQPGTANLVPVQLFAESELTCDLFLSTFALSETPLAVQRLVAESGFLGAESLYVVGQDTASALWEQYELSKMGVVVETARRRYADVTLEPFPSVSAWELTARSPR